LLNLPRDRNGIPVLDDMSNPEMKKGRNGCNRPPPLISTSSTRKERTGATLGKYRNIWPSVK
jgi:hypothetical protein